MFGKFQRYEGGFMERKKIKKRKKQVVSIGLAAILAFSAMSNFVSAEENSAGNGRKYRVGTMQVLFENKAKSGSEDYVKVHVLHDENSDMVWLNAAEFAGYLDRYNYLYDEKEKTAEITVGERQIAFQQGGSIVGYKINDNEGFYRMDDPVVKYEKSIWIPAEEFLHFTGCNAIPIAKDGDTSEWSPSEDFLLVMNPQKTVVDVLADIFEKDNGAYWLFDYEDDFAQYAENVDKKFEKAKDALAIYETLTFDLARIADNITSGKDIVLNFMEEEFGIETVDYDAKEGIKEFVDRMLNPSESLIRAGEEHIGSTLDIADHALSTVDTSTEYMEEVVGTLDGVAGNLQAALKTDYDELKHLIASSEKMESAIENGGLAASVGLQVFGVLQRIINHDESMLKAMDYYLELSDVKNSVYSEVKVQFGEKSNDYIYAAYESAVIIIKESVEEFVEAALKKAGLSVVNFVGSMNNLLWYAIEQTGWASSEKLNRVVIDINIGDKKIIDVDTDTSLATVDEAKAMRMSVYGIMYEMDALKELADFYFDILVSNGYRSYGDLTACTYLALNYLQSCYVTTEAALSAFAHANVEDTESADDAWISYRTKKFADTEQYKNTQNKLEQIAEMITILTEALPYGTDLKLTSAEEESYEESLTEDEKEIRDRLFGVIVSGNDFNANDLTYEVFMKPSTMEDGKDYGFYAPAFDGAEKIILPLVTFGGVINNGGKFVGYQGKTYYWNYSENSISKEGIVGNFEANQDVKNQLICRGDDGKETVILQDISNGPIYISGDIIYYAQSYSNWASCTLDGKEKETYPSTTICGADESRGIVAAKSYETGLTLIAANGDVTTVADKYAEYVGFYNGILYYTKCTDSVNLEIYSYDIDKKVSKQLAVISSYDLRKEHLPGMVMVNPIFTENHMYVLIGCYQGTGMFFEGCVYRMKYDGSLLKLALNATFPKLYLEETESGEMFLYYSESDGYSNVGDGDSYISENIKALNVATGDMSNSDWTLSNINDAVIMDGSVKTLLGTDGKYVEIVSPQLLEKMGFSDLTQGVAGQDVLLRDLDIVGNKAYITFGRMYEDESLSLGWRTGYRRDAFKTFEVEIGTTEAVQLDEF